MVDAVTRQVERCPMECKYEKMFEMLEQDIRELCHTMSEVREQVSQLRVDFAAHKMVCKPKGSSIDTKEIFTWVIKMAISLLAVMAALHATDILSVMR